MKKHHVKGYLRKKSKYSHKKVRVRGHMRKK